MKIASYKTTLAAAGFVAGLSIPIACVVLSALWDIDGFAYLTFFIPGIFGVFGLILGIVIDKYIGQKTMLERINRSLKEESIMDELTGKYNRRYILVELEKEIERARRYKHTLAGIMIDVDDFKKFNDRYGHLLGDAILKEVTNVFDHCIRTIDVLGRYGGDEFIIILPEAMTETATVVAERIKKAIQEHSIVFKKKTLKVTVSIGLHYFADLTNVDKNDFIEKIDQALYLAKTAGKNRIAAKR
jgi:diguanylate cyclase (GGDEF)-like protein